MRFSDLNKVKTETVRPAPIEKARPPALAPVKKAAAAAPAIDREEAVKHGKPAFKLSPRREAKSAPKEPQLPFMELDESAREVYAKAIEQAGAHTMDLMEFPLTSIERSIGLGELARWWVEW